MKKATTAVTSVFLSLALVCSDIAIAAEATSSVAAAGQKDEGESGQQAEPPQRGEIRRPSNALCAGVGIVVGLIAGALLGRSRRNGGDGFSGTAAAIGGVGSALICRAVRWRSVAREDQEDVNRRVGSMTLDPNANVQTYRSPATGKTYTITAGETTYRNNNTEFTTLAEVDSPRQGYKITVTPFVVTAAVLNLRSTPGTDTADRVTGAFYQNDFIESLAETPDGQWVLVGYDGVGYGWVSRRYLAPAAIAYEGITFARPAPPPAPGAVAVAAAPAPRRPARRGRSARRAPVARGPVLVARMTTVPPTRTQRVHAQMACRNFTVAEGPRSDRNRSCAGPRGAVLMG